MFINVYGKFYPVLSIHKTTNGVCVFYQVKEISECIMMTFSEFKIRFKLSE